MDMSLNNLRELVKDREACRWDSEGAEGWGHRLAGGPHASRQGTGACFSPSPLGKSAPEILFSLVFREDAVFEA